MKSWQLPSRCLASCPSLLSLPQPKEEIKLQKIRAHLISAIGMVFTLHVLSDPITGILMAVEWADGGDQNPTRIQQNKTNTSHKQEQQEEVTHLT